MAVTQESRVCPSIRSCLSNPVVFEELGKAQDFNAAPWMQNQQVFIFSHDSVRQARVGKRQNIVVVGIPAIANRFKLDLNRDAVSLDSAD